jgi:polar amino acid transport system permease protein
MDRSNLNFLLPFRYIDQFIGGLGLTLQLLLAAASVGFVFGWAVAFARMAKSRWIAGPAAVYVEIFRSTPSVVQLFWVYYTLPYLLGAGLNAFASVVAALGLNAAAFFGEALRGGLQALPRDQLESADVLGLTHLQKLRFVSIPYVVRMLIPVLLNLILDLFKATSIVATLGLSDLTYVGWNLAFLTRHYIEMLTFMAFIYAAVGIPTGLLVTSVERRLSRTYGA